MPSPIAIGLSFPWTASKMSWDGEAWDYLMLEENAKELIRTPVIPHVSAPVLDLHGAGPGGRGALNSTFLLHGPSDTGKSLTVEALCDHLQVPLIRVSARTFELKPEIVSAALFEQKMLEVCHRWGAILLIDDAFFLWDHICLTVQQKTWPSVFLQHLTSPRGQGVLFLTCKGGHVNCGEGALPHTKIELGSKVPCAGAGAWPSAYGPLERRRLSSARGQQPELSRDSERGAAGFGLDKREGGGDVVGSIATIIGHAQRA
ncbi:hypothetical protein J3F83DRAFT_648735 [Trichoderma novae-zelandiae]